MDYEYTLLQKERACLFNLPAMTSAKGHYLDTWKDMIWEGIVKVTAQNKSLKIYFLNMDKTNFAVSPVPQKYEEGIQKCVDSSRGFAVRLQHSTGKFAWVGLAFRDRNDAFDFNVCFSDFEKTLDRELNPQKYAAEFESTKDFSLKPGEKISFNIAGEKQTDTQAKPKANAPAFKLAPPPGMKATVSQPQQQSQPTKTTSGFNNASDWGNFGNFTSPAQVSNPVQQTQPIQQPSNNVNSGFGFGAPNGGGFDAWGQQNSWGGAASIQNSYGAQTQPTYGGQGYAGQSQGVFGAPSGFVGQQGQQGLTSQMQQNPGYQGFQSSVNAGQQGQPQQQQKKVVETNLIDLL